MSRFESVLEAIGRTPLIKLSRVTAGLGITVLAKVECLNPGGSIKDRIGFAMIEDAEKRGLLKPGGTIIEATAGNTGVGLAMVAAVKGYRCIFVMPDKMSEDKRSLLRAFGAEVVITPTSVPPDSPESYNGVADWLGREIQGAFRPSQFANPLNPEAHYRTTGPEIWTDTEGKIDVLVASMGTGGTISGTGKYLKEKKPSVVVVGADPEGSILSGDTPRAYLVEGIGEHFVPKTFNRQVVDDMVRVSDAESFAMARRLAREEGLLVGGSAGTAVSAAVKYASRLEQGKLMVVILPDTGRNYLTKLFSDTWMAEHGFVDSAPVPQTVGDVLSSKHRHSLLISIDASEMAVDAVRLMERYDVSQLPVLDGNRCVGSVSEMTLVKLLHDGVDLEKQAVREVMARPLPEVEESVDVGEVYRLLMAGHGGVVVTKTRAPIGFLARIDLVNYWSKQGPARSKEARRE